VLPLIDAKPGDHAHQAQDAQAQPGSPHPLSISGQLFTFCPFNQQKADTAPATAPITTPMIDRFRFPVFFHALIPSKLGD
jgi:hypothetical protein